MKLEYLIIGCCLLSLFSCSIKPKQYSTNSTPEFNKILLGKWQSDRGKTIEWLKKHRNFSKEKIEKLDRAVKFGTMIVEIREDSTTYTYDGETTVEPNRVIGSTSNTVAVIVRNPLTNEDEIRLITIEDKNTCSIYVDWVDIKEFFKKIK